MKRVVLLAIILAACASAPRAPITITVLQSGVAPVDSVPRNFDVSAGTLAVRVKGQREIKIVHETSTVLAQLGTAFGFTYVAHRGNDTGPIHLLMRIHHPRIVNAVSGTSSGEIQSDVQVKLGESTAAAWAFDFPWELQPGKWRIEILSDGRVLAARDFDVVVPPVH